MRNTTTVLYDSSGLLLDGGFVVPRQWHRQPFAIRPAPHNGTAIAHIGRVEPLLREEHRHQRRARQTAIERRVP
jgi:hypothetical protein